MKIEKAQPRGWKLNAPDNTYYIGEYGVLGCNPGVIYKNNEAFEKGSGICYIPEYGFSNSEANGTVLFDWAAKACEAECAENNSYITSDDMGEGYTKQHFLDICYGNEEFAKELYDSVNWQSPETLWDEWMEDDEFFETVKKWCKENNVPWDWDETIFFPGDDGDLDANQFIRENRVIDYELEWDDIQKGYLLTILRKEV